MSLKPRWNRCVYHRGEQVVPFFEDYLRSPNRQILIIGGAGFDPRSTQIAELIVKYASERTHGFFIREDRPRPDSQLSEKGDANEKELKAAIPNTEVHHLEIFAKDDAVVGGRAAVGLITSIELLRFTDIFVDMSALSVGVAFPIVRYLDETLREQKITISRCR